MVRWQPVCQVTFNSTPCNLDRCRGEGARLTKIKFTQLGSRLEPGHFRSAQSTGLKHKHTKQMCLCRSIHKKRFVRASDSLHEWIMWVWVRLLGGGLRALWTESSQSLLAGWQIPLWRQAKCLHHGTTFDPSHTNCMHKTALLRLYQHKNNNTNHKKSEISKCFTKIKSTKRSCV